MIRLQVGGLGPSVRSPSAPFESCPRLPWGPEGKGRGANWFIDPDIFTADLDQLPLNRRSR
jgi:hypothetical protein